MRKLIYLLIPFFLSCSTVRKTFHLSRIDSTEKESLHLKIQDLKSERSLSNLQYIKTTKSGFTAIVLDTSYHFLPGPKYPAFIHGNQQVFYLPDSTITEWGNIEASNIQDQKINKTIDQEKTANVRKVQKTRAISKRGHPVLTFFLCSFLLLFCVTISFPKLRTKLFSLNPIKKFL